MNHEYESPAAFKQALEQRLKNEASHSGHDLGRVRQLLVFDRFLARIFATLGSSVVLKGGVALELRLERARATKDIDLGLSGSPTQLLSTLQHAGGQELGDFLRFEILADRKHPDIVTDGLRYGGRRFRAQALLAGKPYGFPFGVDVALAEPPLLPYEEIEGSRLLHFIGIEPASYRAYPIEAHIAEKLHAYTLPRERPNSRVKDLPDMALLASLRTMDARTLREAAQTLFRNRGTHAIPVALPAPPAAWEPVYARIATQNELTWNTLSDVFDAAHAFLDPVLGNGEGTWDPVGWRWRPEK